MFAKKIVITALLLIGVSVRAQQSPSLPVKELFAGMHRIEAEVAATAQSRSFGLMQRRFMPQQRGMLFVFDEQAKHCMWMKNTFLPLSVAFLDEKGRIVNVEDMQPHTEDNHCAAKPARYALEMNLGWFRSRGLSAGFQLTGLDK